MADPMPAREDHRAFSEVIRNLYTRLEALENPSGSQKAQTTRRAAVPERQMYRYAGFGLTAGGWLSYASVTLTVPSGKTTAQIIAGGAAAVLDTTSGGLTSSNGRILINGDVSGVFPAAKDAGASVVNNILHPFHVASFTVTPGQRLQVSLQLQPLNPAAFPPQAQNFASLYADALYTG